MKSMEDKLPKTAGISSAFIELSPITLESTDIL